MGLGGGGGGGGGERATPRKGSAERCASFNTFLCPSVKKKKKKKCSYTSFVITDTPSPTLGPAPGTVNRSHAVNHFLLSTAASVQLSPKKSLYARVPNFPHISPLSLRYNPVLQRNDW